MKRYRKESRRRHHTTPKERPLLPRIYCEWCGNLIAAHSRELLASCRAHARQLSGIHPLKANGIRRLA